MDATRTAAQAAEIALAVKAVGQRLVAAGQRDGYAKVYGELYRRYRVSGYKSLLQSHYQEAMSWLSQWYEELAARIDVASKS
jgi:hypothetical protein